MERNSVIALGETAKGGRVYLQGKWLLKAGFEPDARFKADITPRKIVLQLIEDGTRRVSGKLKKSIPVIDIENQQVRDAFANTPRLLVTARENTITITPAHTLVLVQERRLSMTEGSIPVVFEEMASRLLSRGKPLQSPPIDEEKVKPAVIVVVIKSQPTTRCLQQVLILCFSSIDRLAYKASFFRDVDKTHAKRHILYRRLLSWRRRSSLCIVTPFLRAYTLWGQRLLL